EALNLIGESGLTNCQVATGSVEDVRELFPGKRFDLIYVYFGALNTVEDLARASSDLESLLTGDGKLVLSFVHKWYLFGVLKPLTRLRFKTAFRRLRKVWGGYSLSKFLPSRCYSPAQIRSAFANFNEVTHRGYSILYPAWYEKDAIQVKMADRFWKWDAWLNKTPLWSLGEYTLFVFEKKR